MNKSITGICVSIFLAANAITTAAFSAPVPCEDMLQDVKAGLKSAKLSDTDKTKVIDLQNKGIERCKADDDTHADEFFQQALTLLGK
jgi:hypothetical protein